MLRYCAWCGEFQGHTPGEGSQIRQNVCEIDTATICPNCLDQVAKRNALDSVLRLKEQKF